MAFFFWKPMPCSSGFFICSVYCHYTINKLDKRHWPTCAIVWAKPQLFISCSYWPHLEGWLPKQPASPNYSSAFFSKSVYTCVLCLTLLRRPQSPCLHRPLLLRAVLCLSPWPDESLNQTEDWAPSISLDFPHNSLTGFLSLTTYIHPSASPTGKW